MNLIMWCGGIVLAVYAASVIINALWFWYETRHAGDLPDQWTP